mmetsp:Transcript_44549/g.88031  ORF Transcript_44549/g.88031 Transcript_44549/m.88031 type:complete len:178 (-) Transcript_44549:30-563(-)
MELDSANSMHPLIDGKGEPASEEEEVDPIEDGTQVEGMVASQAEQRGVLQAVGGRLRFAGIGAAKIARGLEPAGEKKKHGEAWTKGMYTHALTKFARGIPAERAFKREGARQHASPKTGSEQWNAWQSIQRCLRYKAVGRIKDSTPCHCEPQQYCLLIPCDGPVSKEKCKVKCQKIE